MPTKTEERRFKLEAHPFLRSLTGRGLVYEGYPLDTVIKVAAGEGFAGDWEAYFEVPGIGGDVIGLGNKLPQEVAEVFFPEWAKRFRWRD